MPPESRRALSRRAPRPLLSDARLGPRREDALQDALLRAWRSLARFEGRSSLRAWLYRISTNTCLDLIARRPKRVLPIDYRPAGETHGAGDEPLVESIWVEPYPDEQLGLEQRESVELAFIAALQHLPARQRAALILRDVLASPPGRPPPPWRPRWPPPTACSAGRAGRRTSGYPEQSQQATLKALGDERLREIEHFYATGTYPKEKRYEGDRHSTELFGQAACPGSAADRPDPFFFYRVHGAARPTHAGPPEYGALYPPAEMPVPPNFCLSTRSTTATSGRATRSWRRGRSRRRSCSSTRRTTTA